MLEPSLSFRECLVREFFRLPLHTNSPICSVSWETSLFDLQHQAPSILDKYWQEFRGQEERLEYLLSNLASGRPAFFYLRPQLLSLGLFSTATDSLALLPLSSGLKVVVTSHCYKYCFHLVKAPFIKLFSPTL